VVSAIGLFAVSGLDVVGEGDAWGWHAPSSRRKEIAVAPNKETVDGIHKNKC
jgi:hypothetical protein